MERATAVIVIVPLVLLTVLPPVFMRRPSLKKRYEAMDDRRLVELQVQYRMLRRNLRIGAYLAPLPLVFLSVISRERAVMNSLLGLCFFASFSLLLAARIFSEAERLATAEMNFRKGKEPEEV
jgi:hypothetical protein